MYESAARRDAVAARRRMLVRLRDVPARYLLGVVALAACYYGAARLGYELQVTGPVAGIVWLPVGVGIAFLYLGSERLWPGVLAGDLLANDYSALPLGTALGQTAGNLLEVLAATVLLRRLTRTGWPLDTAAGVLRMLVAVAVGTALSASVGTLAQLLGSVIGPAAVGTVWRTWWLGDATGALIVLPLALAWYHPPRRPAWHGSRLEAVGMIALVAGVSELAMSTRHPTAFLVFPPLLWAALRFGHRHSTLAVAIAVGITIWNTEHYVGPFVFRSITHMVVQTQLFIGVAALTSLLLSAVVSEREALAEGLRASRARIVEASDIERRRLLRNLHDGAQQRLTALAVHLRLAAERGTAESSEMLDRAGTELTLAIDELRDLAHGLHPALLAQLGLAGAIQGVAARATVPVALIELPDRRFDDSVEATAYYVIAEAVANAQKHAHASSIQVRVVVSHRLLRIEIGDDGVGGAVERAGSGLQGLRDRVEAVGGTFAVDSAAGRGTRIRAAIPA